MTAQQIFCCFGIETVIRLSAKAGHSSMRGRVNERPVPTFQSAGLKVSYVGARRPGRNSDQAAACLAFAIETGPAGYGPNNAVRYSADWRVAQILTRP